MQQTSQTITPSKSRLKQALILIMHQVLATLGVVLWAGVLISAALSIPTFWGHSFFLSELRKVLQATPYYPAEVVVGFLWGWLVWRQFQHRAMLWVWVFPLVTLILGIADDLTRTSELYPGFLGLDFRITLARFFGRSCRLEDHCFDQIGMTMPFYAAVSYAIGAWFALRFPIRSRLWWRIINTAVMGIGIFVLADTLEGVIRQFRLWPWWLILFATALEAMMGACLIAFGVRMSRVEPTNTRECSVQSQLP